MRLNKLLSPPLILSDFAQAKLYRRTKPERILTLLLTLLCTHLYPANDTVGSNTTLSEESFFAFSGKNNRIANAAAMVNGFVLQDPSTTCSFDAFTPAEGPIFLNGGTLYLLQDLKLRNDGQIFNPGIIMGQGHSLEFPSNSILTVLPSGGACGRRFKGQASTVALGAQVNTVDWSFDSLYVAAGTNNQAGTTAELFIYNFNGTSLTLSASRDMGATINSVRWHPTLHFVAVGVSTNAGAETRVFRFTPSTNAIGGTAAVEEGVDVVALAWHPDGDKLTVGRLTNPEVAVYSFNTTTGALTTPALATLEVPGTNKVIDDALDWRPDGKRLAVGGQRQGGAGGTTVLFVYLFNGTAFTTPADATAIMPGNADILTLDWSPTDTYIAVGTNAGNPRFLIFSYGAATLTQLASFAGANTVNGVHWSPDGTCVLSGNATAASPLRNFFWNRGTSALSSVDTQALGGSVVQTARYSPNENFIATGQTNGNLSITDFIRTDSLTLNNVSLSVNSDFTFTTTIKFQGTCAINARGNVFDLTSGVTFILDPGAKLTIRDVHFRGMGSSSRPIHFGTFMHMRHNTELNLSNVSFQLSNHMSTTVGNIRVVGPAEWYLDGFNWVFSNKGTLTVDGVTLWKDSLNTPIASAGTINAGAANFTSRLSGTIKQTASAFDISNKLGSISSGATVINIPHQDSDTVLSSPVSTDFLTGPANSKTMRDHLYLAPNRKLRVTQSSLLTGSGLSIMFAKADEPLLIISAGVTFSLKNVILRNFSPRHVRYVNATTSNLIFDNGTTIELGENDELRATVAGAANTAITWTTRGSVLIKGFGNRLSLGAKPSGIEVEAQSTLTLHHIRLIDLGGTQLGANQLNGTRPFNLRVKHPSSRLDVRNSELVLSGNYTFSAGIMNVYEDNIISGTLVFAYTSSRRLTIQSRSSLMWDRGLTFSYASIPALTVDKGDNTKNKIVFTDASSVLHMNGCTLHSTFTPVKLTAGAAGGTWVVEDKCTIRSVANAAPRAAIIDQASLNIEVLAGATLQVDGLVRMS